MRIRTFLSILLALLLVVAASHVTQLNRDVLYTEFRVNSQTTVPIYLMVLLVFLAGFLPPVITLVAQTLRRDLAARRVRRAARETKSLEAIFRRAIDLQADGQWAKSLAELEPVLKEQSEDFTTVLAHVEALRRAGDAAGAVDAGRRASVLFPQSVAVLYELAAAYDAKGEPQVAREIRSRVLRDFTGLGLAVLRRRRDRALDAADWTTAARLHGELIALLQAGGDRPALELEAPVTLGLRYQEGVRLLEQDQAAEASAVFRSVLAESPDFVPALIMLGEAELVRDDPDAAVAEWQRGFAVAGSPVLLGRLEDHFIERSEPARGIETLRGLIGDLEARGDSATLPRFFLGRLYSRLEMHEEALKMLEGLAPRFGRAPSYHFLLARIHQRRGEMRRAADSFAKCAQQLGVVNANYKCRECRAQSEEWCDRCPSCGRWNTIDLDFAEEREPAPELTVPAPPVTQDSGEWSLPS